MVEDVIREAMERGDFENLPGKGKPLNLTHDPLVDTITSIVNRILRENDLPHPLLDARRSLAAEADQCRADLKRAWNEFQTNTALKPWTEALAKFHARAKEINREVRLFNLKSPSPILHGLAIDADAEVAKICRPSSTATQQAI